MEIVPFQYVVIQKERVLYMIKMTQVQDHVIVGKCDSKFCTQSPNDKSCKWQNETDPTADNPITSMAV